MGTVTVFESAVVAKVLVAMIVCTNSRIGAGSVLAAQRGG